MTTTTATIRQLDNNTQQQEALTRLADAKAFGTPSRVRAAEHDVICCYLSLATALARRYRNRGVDLDDLQQIVRLGLIKAVKRWEPEVGAQFPPFACPTILGELRRHFRDHSSMIRAPRALSELRSEIAPVAEELEQKLGRQATDYELAQVAGVPVEKIQAQRVATASCRSLSLDVQDIRTAATQYVDPSFALDIERVENTMMARQAMEGLTERERNILRLRYFEGHSQAQIGEIVGVSQMQISRIIRSVLLKLRRELHDDDESERDDESWQQAG